MKFMTGVGGDLILRAFSGVVLYGVICQS